MAKIIVVGAGSAGCVVAGRLSEDERHEVLLLEAGPDRSGTDVAAQLVSANWIDAMGAVSAFDPDLIATRLSADPPRMYHRGRGVGGSASVNAMLALPGLPRDYDRWASEYGLTEWSWAKVDPVFSRLKSDLSASPRSEFTPMDRALVDAGAELGLPANVDTYTPDDGGGALWRNADESGRRSSLETYLDPARSRANLTIRPDSRVDRLILDGTTVVGVALVGGTEIRADAVVLSAGTIETPAILLRSGCERPGVGKGLQDHPAASIMLALKPGFQDVRAGKPCINAVLRTSSQAGSGDIHVLPMQGALSTSTPQHHAVVMAAVMTVTSSGEVRLDPGNPTGPPLIEERMLSTQRDRDVMREAVSFAMRLLDTESFRAIVDAAFIDAEGTPVSALEDPASYDRWLSQCLGDYFHAVGTARMGDEHDLQAVVDQRGAVHGWTGARVIDCSVMPEVPAANTHLPVVMLAERLTAQLLADLNGHDFETRHEGESHVRAS